MVVTFPATRPGSGPRPVNLNRDIPQLIDLLQLVFGEKVDVDGQRLMSGSPGSPASALLWRMGPGAVRLSPGFVWEVNGRLIGNVTLLPTKASRRYLVANVAVHPDYRRQGVARLLMEAAIEEVRRRNGRVVMLQVVKDNHPAIRLYETLNFATIGSMTTWQSAMSRLREPLPPADTTAYPEIRPLDRRRWREAFELDRTALHPDLHWPEPLAPDIYRSGLWQRLGNFLNGRQQECWSISDVSGRLAGLAAINSEWARSHVFSVRVAEPWRGHLERPLLAKLVRRLRYLPRRNVRIEHPDDDLVMNQLLAECNLTGRRTLTHMRLDL